jgi:hypothetical protein
MLQIVYNKIEPKKNTAVWSITCLQDEWIKLEGTSLKPYVLYVKEILTCWFQRFARQTKIKIATFYFYNVISASCKKWKNPFCQQFNTISIRLQYLA